MRYKFIRFLRDANPTPGGGNPTPTPAPAPQPTPAPTPAPDPKPDAVAQAKIKELEDKIAELTKTPAPAPTPAPKADDVPAWAKVLVEQNEKLATQLASFQTEKATNTRKTLLETELKGIEGLPESYRDEVIDNFNGRTFENDAAFDTFKKAKVEAAKKLAQTETANSISIFSAPGKSAGGNGKKTFTPAEQAYIDSLKTNKN